MAAEIPSSEIRKAPGSCLEVAAVSPFFKVGAGSFESEFGAAALWPA